MEILILSNEEQDRNLFISCLSADKSSFTFCPSEAKRGEYSAALRRYQEAKPPLDTSRQAARYQEAKPPLDTAAERRRIHPFSFARAKCK